MLIKNDGLNLVFLTIPACVFLSVIIVFAIGKSGIWFIGAAIVGFFVGLLLSRLISLAAQKHEKFHDIISFLNLPR